MLDAFCLEDESVQKLRLWGNLDRRDQVLRTHSNHI